MKESLIFYEVDIQNDFMNKDGRLYVPGAENIKERISYLANLAVKETIRRVRSMDRHFADDLELLENGGDFPRHCMDIGYAETNSDSSYGLDFIPELRVGNAIAVENKTSEGGSFEKYNEDAILKIARNSKDVALEKQNYDVFTNPNVEPLLKAMQVREAIVYGVATEWCVLAAVLGMQNMGIQTYVVENAISGISKEKSHEAIRAMQSSGAVFIKTRDVCFILGGRYEI